MLFTSLRYSEYRKAKREALFEKGSNDDLRLDSFQCPSMESLNTVPLTCPKKPKYFPKYPKSSLMMTSCPRHPGPSEQNHGFRDVVIAAILLGKSVTLTKFTTHKMDRASYQVSVPTGLRFNLERLCQLVELNPEYSGKVSTVVHSTHT